MKKKVFSFILTLVVILSACNQKNKDNVAENDLSVYNAEQLYDQLIACQEDSTKLIQFFDHWNKSVKPNEISDLDNDTIIEIYKVFSAFYKPLDIPELGDSEFGNKLNMGRRYVAIQNKIGYNVLDISDFDEYPILKEVKDTISDFRPLIDISRDSVLYLLPQYEEAINKFLGSELPEKEKSDTTGFVSDSVSKIRYDLLKKYIPIVHGHWGRYFHLETHPQAFYVLFNHDLTKAFVDSRIGYQGCSTYLAKKEGIWKIEKSGMTWIE